MGKCYKTQGYEGLEIKRKNNKYTLEFKLNTVNLYLPGEISYQSIVNELKINNPSIVTRLVTNFRDKGIEWLQLQNIGRASKIPKLLKKQIHIKTRS